MRLLFMYSPGRSQKGCSISACYCRAIIFHINLRSYFLYGKNRHIVQALSINPNLYEHQAPHQKVLSYREVFLKSKLRIGI